jgi:uncharacterized protein (DUF2235 family)
MSKSTLPKNIVLLSDGTGNSSAKLFKTNVWRMFQTLDLSDPARQVAYYDDGVGTSSFKWWAAITGAFGIGLMRNVIDIYSFCCRNYNPGDRIYGFGFSRGAFTIRVVAGLIAYVGLVQCKSESELTVQAEAAYRKFRKRFHTALHIETPLRWLRDRFMPALDEKSLLQPHIEFMGLWDTVDAYGGPIDEITRAIDYWFWPLSMPDRFMNAKVMHACHALSLQDERDAFKPVIWDERYVRGPFGKLYPINYVWGSESRDETSEADLTVDQKRISQVWFTGAHADIGGGYPQDGLSYVTLDWMIDRAPGLEILDDERKLLRLAIGQYDKLNDSRSGLAGYYRYKPRNLDEIYSAAPYKPSISADIKHLVRLFARKQDSQADLRKELGKKPLPVPVPIIHQSVFDRIKKGTDDYAPYVIPGAYRVTGKDGVIHKLRDDPRNPDLVCIDDRETPKCAEARATRQEAASDWTWKRRVVYFLTVGASLLILALPIFESKHPGLGKDSPLEFLIPLIDGLGHVLPSFASYWIDAFKAGPERLAAGLVLLAVILHRGAVLKAAQHDCMRAIWLDPKTHAADPSGAIYWLRSQPLYQAFFYLLKNWVLPSFFMVVIGYGLFIPISRVAFGVADATGLVCGEPKDNANKGGFKTLDICTSTGQSVTKGTTYAVTLTVGEAWDDGGIATGPNGFGLDNTGRMQKLGLPLRRLVADNWFATVLRVGRFGYDEYVLNFVPDAAIPPKSYTATFKARSNGEVFVFVNDAVVGLPWAYDFFYRHNNHGTATIALDPKN